MDVEMEGGGERMPSSSYTNAVEAALAMAAAYETKKARDCKPKKRKKAPPAPPLVPNEHKKLQQTRKERGLERKKTAPRQRERQDRRPCSSSPDARPQSRPPRRSDGSETTHRQKTTQERRAPDAGSHCQSRPSPEVVNLLSPSSSSASSSVGSRSRSSSVSSLSSLSSLTSSDGEGDKKRVVLNGRVLSRNGKLAGGEISTESDRDRSKATTRGGKPEGSLHSMRESSGDNSQPKLKRKIAAKQAAVKSTQPSHSLVQKSTEALSASMTQSLPSNSSSPASPPKLLQARKSVARPSPSTTSSASIQGCEEDMDAFGRPHCHKAASAGSTTSGDTNFTLPSSAYAAKASSSPPSKKRRVSSFFNTDKVSLTELQAQERELAWIRSQRNQRQNRNMKTANTKHPDADSQRDADGVSLLDGAALHGNHPNQPNKGPKVLTDGEDSSGMAPYNSICHPTSYRGVFLDEAPPNLLPVPGCTAPFESDYDRPLTFYDETGTLTSQCSFLTSFGKTSQCISSVFPGMAVKSQSDVTRSVSAVVTAHLPIIRRCYRRKVCGILKEARKKIAQYQAALEKLKPDHDHGVKWHMLPRSPVEKRVMRQLKSVQRSFSLNTRSVSFQIGRGDGIVQEKSASSLIQVNLLKEVQPLRKYTTSIGLRANYRVEDNPFLHYGASSSPIGGTRGGENVEKYGLRIGSVADEEVVEFVLRLVVGRLGDSGQVFHALKSEFGFSQAYTAYSELKKLHDSQQQALIRFGRVKELVSAGESEGRPDVAAIVKLMELSSLSCGRTRRAKSLSQRLQPPSHDLESNIVDNLVDNSAKSGTALGLRATGVYNELVHVYGASFCRMCYSYACQEHGGDHPLPARRVDPVYPRVRSFSDVDLCAEGEIVSTEDEVEHLGSKVIDTAGSDHDAIASCGSRGGHDTSDTVRQETRRSSIAVSECNNMKNDIGMIDSTDASWRCNSKATADPSEFFNAWHIPQVAAKMEIFLSTDSHCSEQCWKITGHRAHTRARTPTASADASTAFAGRQDSCGRSHDPCRNGPKANQDSMSPSELGLVRKLRDTMGDNSCLLAAIMGSVSCSQLHDVLQKHENGAGDRHGRHLRKWKQGQRAKGSNHELLLRTRNQRLQDRGAATHEYVPCMHEGTCDSAGCTCMQRDHMCEKACACSRDCPNRFEGCKCLPGQCRTAACLCFAALRECDADVCLACGAVELVLSSAISATTPSGSMLLTCGNINVTHRYHQRLCMRFSSVHGYGLYAREAIAANAFVYEYTGAMISQDEAERRGRIYDKKERSYLFDLNEDAVLDALRRGNKSKFINHDGEAPNCTAKVVSVCGVHHITIWAVRDISAGEELVYDYGYKPGVGPDWSQHRAALNGSS